LPYAQDDRLVSFGLSQSLEKQEFTLADSSSIGAIDKNRFSR